MNLTISKMFNFDNYFENSQCPCCKNDNFRSLKEPDYSAIARLKDFESMYKSSAYEKLIDRLVKCNVCSFQYLNPRIQSKIVETFYEKNV